ncbi:Sterile alpha motif domain-containing protein 15-like [Oopsacas minuta]|uniref:Sterile alpha motif domain-containing protein 15-like n=1 Tax=Oopsacas minuta TaxID=111878 RepID=A0AAV7K9R5_9METZ|nr:Sterile alpha motif domain-containing protein 15-like [Oopsacas minuta]
MIQQQQQQQQKYNYIQIKSNKLSLKKRDVLRHEYNFVEDLIRELVDFLQDAHKQTLSNCVTPDLAINPNLKECTFFTSLCFDKVQYCINAVHTQKELSSKLRASATWVPPKENPYTGLWAKEMVIPVDRFAAELLLLQYGTVGSYIVRPKVEGLKRDYVISIRTENDVTHVKVVEGENGYSLPNSTDATPSLEQFVEVFTFKESQLANISLKPVRLPTEKIEEFKKKDEERRGTQAVQGTLPPVVKKCALKKGQSVEDLLKSLPPPFVHATMTTSTSGYEGDTDTLESIPPTPPPPFCPDMAFSPATSTRDISEHKLAHTSLAAANERSCSFTALNSSLIIPEDSIVDSVTNLIDSFASCPVLQEQPLSPTPPRKNLTQRVSAIHTPLPPVPIHSPSLNKKLKDSFPNTSPDVQDYMFNEYDHPLAPPVPFRPHALTKPTSENDFKGMWRNQKPDSRIKRQRPLSIKMTSSVQDFRPPMPSSISTIDFSSPQRSDSDLARTRKGSVGSRPFNVNPIGPTNRYHTQVERKISTNLFPTQPTLPIVEDRPTSQLTPEPIQEPDAVDDNLPDIEGWSIEEVGTWLEEIGLPQYKTTFSDNDIDGSVLTMLTNENLKDDIGITSFGHRAKIIKQIKNIQKY